MTYFERQHNSKSLNLHLVIERIKRDSSKINRAAPASLTTVELLLAALTVPLTTLCHRVRVTISLCLSVAHLFS